MTQKTPTTAPALRDIRWPLRITWAGMVAERVTRGFWPVWTMLSALIAALSFGLQESLSVEVFWIGLVLSLSVLVGGLAIGIRRFRVPSRQDAMARLDASLPGRPIATLTDQQAVGGKDPASALVWRAHLERMATRLAGAQPVAPDLRLATRDPYALRYAALTALVMALLFGSVWKVGTVATDMPGAGASAAPVGPSWEAWLEPPRYTGKPSLYLNTLEDDAVTVPEGTRVTIRLYAPASELSFYESVSGDQLAESPAASGDAPVRAMDFEAARSGTLTIEGAGGREWLITVQPDAAPAVEFAGTISRQADGVMSQPFTARDDYAVLRGRAEVRLDASRLQRRHGLAAEPEPQETLVYDLPLPFAGSRADFTETLVEDASKHVWSNLPVKIRLFVEDARGQFGQSEQRDIILPGRRFFDPLAAAVAEMRRDLLWSRDNGKRTAQILRAITHRPEGFIRNERAYLMLRVAMRRLDGGLESGSLDPDLRDEVAEALWEVAILIEDGGLADALEKMRQAQERLAEAIRNGASPEEIQKLMDDLKQATNDYIRELAENAQREGGTDEPDRRAENGQTMTGDQLQQMMDEIQRLMEEGRMAEAQELLDQLSRMMENLRVTQGEGGSGEQSPGGQAMRDLQQTLRGQQQLSDEAFRRLQQGGRGGSEQQEGEPGQPGGSGDGSGLSQNQPGEGEAQDGIGQGNGDQPSLAERQQALRDQLAQQEGRLPDTGGGDLDEAARQALRDAGRAMQDAEGALRDGDMATALDRQAEAIRNLREGLRNLGEALAQNRQDQPGNQGQAQADGTREVPRDPLGRTAGNLGGIDSDRNMLQGRDVYRRAIDLLDELRRRSNDRTRPQLELDYLRRLLDRF
ncbi:TIGR02302 family protein [Defluviimonas sp. WL0002]|uniref:TIGR02302 family protein n=1 Tax=Albidovulum marisflavi TaxID=2984159 RepID=A0ABT2Z7N2_9RHOB|nr:TIGR02302 family protein [Defluviimonas sp. WL0002]MCV2867147.1 TIGR02302 family protein [Defluviimonas sp. WL0002]